MHYLKFNQTRVDMFKGDNRLIIAVCAFYRRIKLFLRVGQVRGVVGSPFLSCCRTTN